MRRKLQNKKTKTIKEIRFWRIFLDFNKYKVFKKRTVQEKYIVVEYHSKQIGIMYK